MIPEIVSLTYSPLYLMFYNKIDQVNFWPNDNTNNNSNNIVHNLLKNTSAIL